jgi:putative ABC transport system permease protein
VTVAVLERPVAPTTGDGGAPARRAMIRWAWRLFRREWRRQALVLALLVVAVAAMVVGLGVASNATNQKADPTFGTANTILNLPGTAAGARLSTDLAAIRDRFGPADIVTHQALPVPGSVSTIDMRSEDPRGAYTHVTLRLDAGRYPNGPGEVALTSDAASTFGLHLGSVWSEGGQTLHVVGMVENPLDLRDQFALLAPGQASHPDSIAILVDAAQHSLQSFRLPGGPGLAIESRGAGNNKVANETIILVLGTLGLVFVGLMAVAGFSVMAQRRLRALGMLGSIGATDRHIRLVMVANGAAVGATAAVVGTATGLAAWFAFVPTLRSISQHRVDPFAVPWWAIAAAMLLTLVTAVVAAWWPARAVTRISVVAALSGRPPRPQPAHRFAALGGIMLGIGLVLLAFADKRRVAFTIGGTVATPIGVIFLAPLAIQALAGVGSRSTIAVRLALRDLARYQARSGAALGAITLAVGIAATIAISASAAQTPTGPGNLPANQLMLYLTPGGAGSPVPPIGGAQQQAADRAVAQLGAVIHADTVVALDQAYNTQGGVVAPPGGSGSAPPGYLTAVLAKVIRTSRGVEIQAPLPLYVAMPAVLDHFGITTGQIDPASDVISGRADLSGLDLFDPSVGFGPPDQQPATRQQDTFSVKIQVLKGLPPYTSDDGTLITTQAMQRLGFQPLPAAWLIQTSGPLSGAQIAAARKAGAGAGLYIETRTRPASSAPLRNWSTAAGILLALGVLAMTVGLIRSETANDLRTLAAAGASSRTRRTLTGATAGALALLGAALGSAGAYSALLAWHRSDLSPLGRVPVVNLIVILVGLPVIATAAGWLLAGAEPSAMARQPLD